LLFHVPNSEDVSQYLEDESRAFGGLSLKTLRVLTRLRNHVERWTQEVLSESLHGGILLIDGSLTAGTPDNPAARVNKILATARQNNSIVIGISKATQLTVGGRNILGLTNDKDTPHQIDISSLVESEYPPHHVSFPSHAATIALLTLWQRQVRSVAVLIYRKECDQVQLISFPDEHVQLGDYLLIEDPGLAKGLLFQVIDLQYANVPGILED